MTERGLAAAEQLAEDGIDAEVIDLRWLRPLDLPAVRASVEKTGRIVVAEEQVHAAGWGATIISELTIGGIAWASTPRRVSLPDDLPIPYTPPLEDEVLPSVEIDRRGGPGQRRALNGPVTAPVAPRTLDRNALIVDRIETIALRAPLGRRFSGSAYSMDNRCTIVTRLYTHDGLVSEVYTGDTDVEQSIIVAIIHDELAPRLLGRTATDPEGAWLAMEPATNDILRDRGLALQAISCVDEAIWDVFGRAVGLPLHRIWGSTGDTVPISIIGGYYHLSIDEMAEVIHGYVEAGFAGMKFKVGGRTPAEDAARVRAARAAAGPDFVLMVDANQGYDRAQAVKFAQLVWDLEHPLVRGAVPLDE